MRAVLLAAIAATALAFAAVQAASDAFSAPAAAAPGTLPARVPIGFGLAVYRALDRIAPAPYVESTLAAYALDRGDPDTAQRYALRLPASPSRDEMLGRIAQARGDDALAFEYYLAAPDVDRVRGFVDAALARDPARAYALERLLEVRLALLTTHPDAVAQAYFRMGELANQQAFRQVPAGPAQGLWLHRAMDAFGAAVALTPLSEKFAIAAANQAMLLGDLPRAAALFAGAADANPGSADAVAGVGVIAYQRGDLATARTSLARARKLDPNALMVRALERDLR